MKFKTFIKNLVGNYGICGRYIKRYRLLYIVVLAVVSLFEAIMFVRGLIHVPTETKHYVYLFSYVFLFLLCGAMIVVLILDTKVEFKDKTMSTFANIFASLILVWASTISVLDSINDHLPLVYMTIVVVLGGVLVINPIVFLFMVLISGSATLALCNVWSSAGIGSGDLINIGIFLVMAIIIGVRNYVISVAEHKTRKILSKLSHTDSLTTLPNTTAFYEVTDELDIKSKNEEYAVIIVDLNCLKETNDLAGHRFGSQLIVTAAKELAAVFGSENCYRVGGDEFAVVLHQKSDEAKAKTEAFAESVNYQNIIVDGKKLILSLAVGLALHEKGESFATTLHKADQAMYQSKKEMKAKYDFKSVIEQLETEQK